jgi:hypothetical protein
MTKIAGSRSEFSEYLDVFASESNAERLIADYLLNLLSVNKNQKTGEQKVYKA